MLRILHIEDSPENASLIQQVLTNNGIEVALHPAGSRSEFLAALEQGEFDLILTDNGLPGLSGLEALETARKRFPAIGFICVSGSPRAEQIPAGLNNGNTACASKDGWWRLVASIRREQRLSQMNRGMSRLVMTVQELSLARDLNSIMAIVRHAARELTGADGATFILRDGEMCHYADEEAIAPLWKGQKFPLKTCISGWAMLNRQVAVIEDIYADARIPTNAYRPTFVKSLAMVPIRAEDPIGAIGNYWASRHLPTAEEIDLLQALANTTAVARENVRIYDELEQRVKDRTARLEIANRELDSFSHAVSHDLGAPLRSISGFIELASKECNGALTEKGRRYFELVRDSADHMRELMGDLLRLSKVSRAELRVEKINLGQVAREVMNDLMLSAPERKADVRIADGMEVEGDHGLLRIVLENLLSNAWKYTGRRPRARIEFEIAPQPDGSPAFCIRDNGAGFDMEYADKLFQPFQRLHRQDEFPGTGIGLTTVQRIIHRHGGRVWADGKLNDGAAFYFTVARPAGVSIQ
jgi:signal transduction histidine kinase/CheY-like chemotaxis protein